MVARLVDAGDLAEEWRGAFLSVPRDVFMPECVWDQPAGEWRRLCRPEDPDGWLSRAYANAPVITQLDDGTQNGRGQITSSISMPGVVAEMLGNLRLEPGMRVLEIGTGSGYNAALLAERTGAGNVTSIEVGADLADAARRALRTAGYDVRVIAGDGGNGCPDAGPFDRIIATAAAERVPYAWVEQTKPGGQILTPWGTAFNNGVQVRLDVDADGRACGPVVGGAAFMWLRDQRVPFGDIADFVHDEDTVAVSSTSVDLAELTGVHAGFAIGTRVENCHSTIGYAEDDSGEWTLWLFDHGSGDWASVDYEPGAKSWRVEQVGRRRLWDEVEDAYGWWAGRGRPRRERFGLSVTAEGQAVWLGEPDNVIRRYGTIG